MTFLAALLPMLQGDSEFNFKVTKTPTGLRVVTIPNLKNFQPDTTDEELGKLQAALALPLVFAINDVTQPDHEMALLLQQAAGIRKDTIDQLSVYQDAQREAQQAARAAQEKKTAAAAKKPEKAGKTVAATPATPVANEVESTEDAEAGMALTEVAASTSPATVPAVTTPIQLFAD